MFNATIAINVLVVACVIVINIEVYWIFDTIILLGINSSIIVAAKIALIGNQGASRVDC